jgi:hypothetical protein
MSARRKMQALQGLFQQIPYATEQGISKGEQGTLSADQGTFRVEQGTCPLAHTFAIAGAIPPRNLAIPASTSSLARTRGVTVKKEGK